MPDVSAAIVVLAGAVLTVSGVIASSMTDASRQKLVGFGFMVTGLGVIAWLLAFAVEFTRVAKL